MNKYEQLIEYIINEDEDKAKALFHDIVVEKSRDIYETLIDEETFDESIGGNEVEDLVDEIQADETDGIPEDAEEDMDAEEEMMGGGGEMPPGPPPKEAPEDTAGETPGMEVEASYKSVKKTAAAKKGAAEKSTRDYIQEVLERSRR